jgi:anti-sigma factor RsiW
MSAQCSAPISWEDLVAYWAGDLDAAETDRVDEHLMGCDVCSATSGRIAAVTEGVRGMIPLFLSPERVAALRASGVSVVENPCVAAVTKPALFPLGADVLLHRLGGLDLAHAASVGITVSREDTGEVLLEEPQIPFDAVAGEVLVACQRHLGEYPRTIIFEVRARDASGAVTLSRFAVPHLFEARRGE